MKKQVREIVTKEIEVPFDIKIIQDYLNGQTDFINDVEDWIDTWCDNLTDQELLDHRSEILNLIVNHNHKIIKQDLKSFVKYCIKNDNYWCNWKPTKDQLIEAINKYYE